MTASAAAHDEPYRELVDYSWTDKAFEMIERDNLHGEVVSHDGVVTSRVWGPCPRCGHQLDDKQTHTAITNLMSGQWRTRAGVGTAQTGGEDADSAFFPVDVSCGCGDSHLGAPPGTTGCGVSFRVELPMQFTSSSQP